MDEFCAAVYAWMLGDAGKEAREAFDAVLFRPPAHVRAEVVAALPEWQPEAQGANFLAQLAMRGPEGGRTAG